MSKPWIHALSSAKKYGGVPEDYVEIHEVLDSAKGIIADVRFRAMTHNAWFISQILPRIFGNTFTNSEGKVVSTRDIGEQHCSEDYGGMIPSAQDFLELMDFKDWMSGGKKDQPSSYKKITEHMRQRSRKD